MITVLYHFIACIYARISQASLPLCYGIRDRVAGHHAAHASSGRAGAAARGLSLFSSAPPFLQGH